MKITDDGSLVVTTPAGQLSESKPRVYQEIGGHRIPITARFTLEGSDAYAFELSEYNTGHPLVVDPTLLFSSYLGGNGGDQGNGVAVDSNGNVYVTGRTTSSNFPITVGQTASTVSAAFITKLNPAGTALVYSTYIQSPTPWWDSYWSRAIAVDHSGNAYIAGFASVQTNPASPCNHVSVGPCYHASMENRNSLCGLRLFRAQQKYHAIMPPWTHVHYSQVAR